MEPIINGHLIKKPPQSGHLQSTAKRPLSIVRMSNFMQGQDGNLWQTIETENHDDYRFLIGLSWGVSTNT